jgi:hypothetical protein
LVALVHLDPRAANIIRQVRDLSTARVFGEDASLVSTFLFYAETVAIDFEFLLAQRSEPVSMPLVDRAISSG